MCLAACDALGHCFEIIDDIKFNNKNTFQQMGKKMKQGDRDLNALQKRCRFWALGLVALMAVAACGESEDVRDYGASDEVIARAKVLTPADPVLAELYQTTCYYCHAFPESMSPLTGDRNAWDGLMEKGLETLVKNTIEGYEGMPPLGGCMACSRDEFAALTAYMATAE